MKLVIFELKENSIGLITIKRKEALNSINMQILSDLKEALDQAEAAAVRALIITGEGEKAFAAGADIGDMKEMSQSQAKEYSLTANSIFHQVEFFPSPVIAAVNGYALGGGCELSLACDMRVASENAVFSFPEVGLGITPGWGGMQRMARAVGQSRARQLVFTASRVKAAQALEIGLVNAVCPQEELLSKCEEMALSIAKNAPIAVRAAKKAMNEGMACSSQDATNIEAGYFASCFETVDQRQAMSAFVEKRKADLFLGK